MNDQLQTQDEAGNVSGRVERAIYITVLAQFFSKLGDTFASAKTVLPWLLQALGAPAFMIPLLVPIRESGSLIPQVMFSRFVDQRARKKHVWSLACVLQGACIILIGITTFIIDGTLAGWVIIGLLVVFSLSRCLASISAKLVLAKTIPKSKRGSTTGMSASAAGAIAIILGLSISMGWISMSSQAANTGMLGTVLLVAGICWFVSAAVFLPIAESRDVQPSTQSATPSLWSYLRPQFSDAVFVRYLLARILFLTTAMSAPYYVLLSGKAGVGSVMSLGLLILASGLAGLLSGAVWGKFADSSSRRVWIFAAFGAALSGIVVSLLTVFFPSVTVQIWFIPLFYLFLEICHQGVRVGRKTYVVNAANDETRAAYVTASNTVVGLVLLLIGGVAAVFQNIAPHIMIAAFSMLCLIGCLVASGLPEVEALAE